MVQLSHPYMTTRKTIALTIWTFVNKIMTLLFNMLPRFVIAFLSRSKHLLISWLQSPSTVILEPKNIKSVTLSTFSPSICHKVMGPGAMTLIFWMLSFKIFPVALLQHRRPWVRKILWRKRMEIHCNILAWRIPWTEEPGRLQSNTTTSQLFHSPLSPSSRGSLILLFFLP